jgi:hypothetical protein
VANLARNIPQFKIDIFPFCFICFAETGVQKNGEKDDAQGLVTFVYFLAIKGSKVALLKLD